VSLVLALEPDPRQAAVIKQVVRDRVGADFVLADSKDAALAAITERVPDLILVTALLSPRDESDLTDRLRDLEGADHLQTLTIPLLAHAAVTSPKRKKRGLLSALTGEADAPVAPSGCDPAVFAAEVADYIARAEERKAEAAAQRAREDRRARKRRRETSATGPADEAAPPPAQAGGSYWDWEPSPTPSADTTPTASAVVAVNDPGTPPVPGYSSWANPWDVSNEGTPRTAEVAAAAIAVEDADGATDTDDPPLSTPKGWHEQAREALAALAAEPAPTYLDDHEIDIDPPVASIDPLEALLLHPAPVAAADLIEEAAPAPDEEIDLSALLVDDAVGSPTTEAQSDIYTLSPHSLDLASLDPAETPPAAAEAALRTFEGESSAPAAESPALEALRADLDRLRADRESVEAALAEARAAQRRAETAAEEASARGEAEAERRALEVAARAREEARVERLGRDDAERRALEEAERRVEAERSAREDAERRAREEAERRETERLARDEADRLAREAQSRMREEADAERRLREEAERLAREAEAARAREAEERRVRDDAEREAREAAEQQFAAERRAREDAEARAAAERAAREDSERRAREEAERLAREADDRRAREETERKAREAAEARADAERRAREEAEQRARAEVERLAREASERRAAEDAERKAREVAERAAQDRSVREQAERAARLAADQRAEVERAAREAERAAAQAAAKAKDEAERLAKDAAARAREEVRAERKAREEAERRAAAERKAREEAERRAKQEVERRTAAEAKAQRDAERHAAETAARPSPKKTAVVRKPRRRVDPAPPPAAGPSNGKPRPTLDEWGLYDPDKCGFGALYAKLEEIEGGQSVVEDEPSAADLLGAESSEPGAAASGRNPRPLSMWAWRAAPPQTTPPPKPLAGVGPDDFRGMVARLNIPAAVAAVRYASGARIHRVKVSPAARPPKREASQVIILSRKILEAVREQAAGPRSLTARR
jgi:CheY-like chemotaxis protein